MEAKNNPGKISCFQKKTEINMVSSCDSISIILGLIVIICEGIQVTETQWHNCLLYLHMCPSPHLPQMQQDLWQWRRASFSEAHIQHSQLFLWRWPCFLFAGTDHGGVKRSIGEIVDTDEPSIPRKKKYAKEAWPGATKFCQVKKNNRINQPYQLFSCKMRYCFPGRKPGPAQGLFWEGRPSSILHWDVLQKSHLRCL